ncbi:hypothetical protein GPJ55_24210 [Bacillus subtilis]|nr:hypothetical protein GPJ55_24210 [Bacillus subtilis]
MKKLICIVAVMLFLSSASYVYAGTIGDPPGTPGKWYKGEEPIQKDGSKPTETIFSSGFNMEAAMAHGKATPNVCIPLLTRNVFGS